MVRHSLRSSNQPEAEIVTLTGRGFRSGLLALLPIALFTLPFGLAFGAAAIDRGLSSLQVIAMSTLVFSGAAQFAALDVWMTPPSFFTVFLTVLAVSARHLILGASISPWVNGRPPRDRVFVLLFLSDPNFAHGNQAFRSGERDIGTLVGGGVILWFCWVAGTAVGASAGKAFGDLTLFGIDVLMVSYFAALAAGDRRTRTKLAPTAAAVVAAVFTLSILPVGWNVVVAAIVGGQWRLSGNTGRIRRGGHGVTATPPSAGHGRWDSQWRSVAHKPGRLTFTPSANVGSQALMINWSHREKLPFRDNFILN